MQAVQELPRSLSQLQLLEVSLIDFDWNLAQMLEQFVFTFGREEHLVAPETIEFSSRFTPTDAPLVTPDTIEKCF